MIESKEKKEVKITKPIKNNEQKERMEVEIKETSKTPLLLVGKRHNILAEILSKKKTCLDDI